MLFGDGVWLLPFNLHLPQTCAKSSMCLMILVISTTILKIICILWYHIGPYIVLKSGSVLFQYCFQYCASTVSVLCQYCVSTVLVLFQYCFSTVSVLFQYCVSTVSILYQHCFSTVSVLFQHCVSTVSVLF